MERGRVNLHTQQTTVSSIKKRNRQVFKLPFEKSNSPKRIAASKGGGIGFKEEDRSFSLGRIERKKHFRISNRVKTRDKFLYVTAFCKAQGETEEVLVRQQGDTRGVKGFRVGKRWIVAK